jgi:hypothetical protein
VHPRKGRKKREVPMRDEPSAKKIDEKFEQRENREMAHDQEMKMKEELQEVNS